MANQKNNLEQTNQAIDPRINSEHSANEFPENKNKIWIIVGIVFAVIIIISSGILLFFKVSNDKQKLNVNQGMLSLCRENDSCCLASLNAIGKNNFELADESGNCSEGFKKNMLRCESSLKWCEPIKEYCAKAGEAIGAQGMYKVCCLGLKAVGGWPGGYEGDCSLPAPPTGLSICLDCGDGNCNIKTGENKCNCPEDCGNGIGKEIALCEEIVYEDSRNRCYIDYAMSRNNISLCEKITGNVLKEECYNNLNKKDETDKPVLWALGSEPDAMSIAKVADVLFTTMQTGSEDKANKIIVEELDVSGSVIKILGDLNDDGVNGDLSADDYIYSGTFKITSTEEGTLFFRAKANFSNISDSVYTDIYKFGVTRFPVESSPADMSKVVINPKTGQKMISNEVLIGFIKGTSPDTIENIVKAVNGEVVGTIFGLSIYQIKILDTGDATGVNKAIDELLNYPEVEFAEPNYIGELDFD